MFWQAKSQPIIRKRQVFCWYPRRCHSGHWHWLERLTVVEERIGFPPDYAYWRRLKRPCPRS